MCTHEPIAWFLLKFFWLQAPHVHAKLGIRAGLEPASTTDISHDYDVHAVYFRFAAKFVAGIDKRGGTCSHTHRRLQG
jgi:hypothetical protein